MAELLTLNDWAKRQSVVLDQRIAAYSVGHFIMNLEKAARKDKDKKFEYLRNPAFVSTAALEEIQKRNRYSWCWTCRYFAVEYIIGKDRLLCHSCGEMA